MRVVFLILALSLCGCASQPVLPGPTGVSGFGGFPSSFADGQLLATARFKTDHASQTQCRVDLIATRGVIPIWVSAGLNRDGQRNEMVRVSRDHMDMRLYLPDGTALMPLEDQGLQTMLDSLDDTPKRYVTGRLFEKDVLEEFSNRPGGPNNGYMFFKMPSDNSMSISGRSVRHIVGDAIRSFDLNKALISFNITVDDVIHPVMVGVQ